ncbi:hypothetical protein GGX14DRAFT_394970 [Mycena pura]|uniref:Uncharacterized protein n=1 Tax=Mycena pura TaxID=153505 RepID=A0AAD6VDX7_9AGAR|nr:hypothetical protein GGX14DRAFT_394970 [Mycena pura]
MAKRLRLQAASLPSAFADDSGGSSTIRYALYKTAYANPRHLQTPTPPIRAPYVAIGWGRVVLKIHQKIKINIYILSGAYLASPPYCAPRRVRSAGVIVNQVRWSQVFCIEITKFKARVLIGTTSIRFFKLARPPQAALAACHTCCVRSSRYNHAWGTGGPRCAARQVCGDSESCCRGRRDGVTVDKLVVQRTTNEVIERKLKIVRRGKDSGRRVVNVSATCCEPGAGGACAAKSAVPQPPDDEQNSDVAQSEME